MTEDVQFIMREVGVIGEWGSSLQTIVGFLFWLSVEHPEVFEEYLKSKEAEP